MTAIDFTAEVEKRKEELLADLLFIVTGKFSRQIFHEVLKLLFRKVISTANSGNLTSTFSQICVCKQGNSYRR